ncbi:MAG: hypothetical protein ABI678_05890 [Kofleriaceae bacterium]
MTLKLFRSRAVALALTASLATAPLLGCSNNRNDPPPPVDDTAQGGVAARKTAPDESHHMSTRSKLVVLGGAAALYYLYKHHKAAAANTTGVDSQYYLSKNGRVYYRDADHRAHWVTPPAEGIQVPANEAAEFEQYQGYENRTSGRDLVGLGTDADEAQ